MSRQHFRECLTEHDQKVLESLFNPFENSGGSVSAEFNLELEAEVIDSPEEKSQEVVEAVNHELEGIRLTESGNLDEAIIFFDKAINKAHHRCSTYNNRAQALRLKGNDKGALDDLQRALNLSTQQPRTRCQALCQRGLLHRKLNNIDAAKVDFEEAAELGSKFARTQLVELNPYAALCNQMLQVAFTKMQ